MPLIEILKAKVTSHDLVKIGERFYPAQKLKRFIRAAKKLEPSFKLTFEGTIEITYKKGDGHAFFNPAVLTPDGKEFWADQYNVFDYDSKQELEVKKYKKIKEVIEVTI